MPRISRRSRSRKKLRKVRIAAIAASRPMSSKLGAIRLDDVGRELEGQRRHQPACVVGPDVAGLHARGMSARGRTFSPRNGE